MRQRIVERLVPAIEADLSIGGGGDHDEDRAPQQKKRIADPGRKECAHHHPELGNQSRALFGLSALRPIQIHGPTLPFREAKRDRKNSTPRYGE